LFRKIEVDYLAVNKSLQIIVLLEDGLEGPVLCCCAQNSSKFLDAIYLAACYLDEFYFNDNLNSNQAIICPFAKECSELAGGNEYLNF
jgi:hypothetical protein